MDEMTFKQEKVGVFNPREFILRNLKYLPWIIFSLVLFVVLAYIKLRYTTEVYDVKSKMLVKNENSFAQQDRLESFFMSSESQSLIDEIEILKSSGISKRVVYALGFQTSYYNKGKVKVTTIHPSDAPFKFEIISLKDSLQSVGLEVKFVNESTVTLNNETQPVYLGQVITRDFGKFRLDKRPVSYQQFASNEFTVVWQPADQVAYGMAGTFKIAPITDYSNVLLISLETPNPKIGKDIVNQLMQEYNMSSMEDKRRTTQYTLEFIDERLDTIKRELGGVEQSLQNFREKNKAIDLSQQSLLSFNELSDVNQILTQQEVQLKVLGYLQNYIADERNMNKTVPTQLGIEEPSLASLIQQYNTAQLQREMELKTTTAANPLIQKIDVSLYKLRQQIQENLNNIRQSYLINRNNLLSKTRSAESDISSVPGKTKRMLEITRQQKILEDLYSFLLQKKLETSISSAATISNSKVVEPARSSNTPVKPDRKSTYLSAIFLGLAIPVGLIALKEYLNDKITNRIDVEKLTKVPILGEIGHSDDSNTLVATKNNRKFIAEQFRIIRTNLQFILNKVERPIILITSSFSGEGKSFISTNMGAVLALAGKKTVILEFDIRKPKIIAGLDLARKSGLTNFIVGNASITDIILPVEQVENLFVIPCGPIPPNPSELILDEKVKELFVQLRQMFEVVIVDSAPIGLVSDAINLSHHADATLYIMRQNYTVKKQINLINDFYENNKLPRLSLLLNDVKLGPGYSNYYGYGYGYGTGSGYFSEETKKRKSFFSKLKKTFS